MLSIILLILKIIGIILLILLGLIVLLLLMILFVPIRYSLQASHGESVEVVGRVSWLLHIIHGSFSYLEEKFLMRVRLFGFIVYDSQRIKPPKKNTNSSKHSKKAISAKKKPKVKKTIKKDSLNKSLTIKQRENHELNNHKEDTITIIETRQSQQQQINENENDLPEALRKYAIYETKEEDENQFINETPEANKKQEQTVKETLFSKLYIRIQQVQNKIRTFFKGLKKKLLKAIQTIKSVKDKANLIWDLLQNEINKEGFSATFSSLKKLMKHILPTKLRSKIIFGTGDPCSTGQALGVLGILYSLYGDKVMIIPDFENSRLEGTHYARGRIRIITVLIIVIKLMIDKRFKQLKKNFNILKEAL